MEITETLKNGTLGDRLKRDLRRQIQCGQLRPGDPVLSERRLATSYKISYLTARKAISELVDGGYLFRLPRKGIFVTATPPALELQPEASPFARTIAVMLADLRNEFSAACLEGLEKKAEQAGYQMMVFNSALDTTREAKYLKQLLEQRVAGVAMIPCFPPINGDLVLQFRERGIPLVMMDRFFPSVNADFVGTNNFEVGLRAVNYLISLGHRQIAHITSHSSNAEATSVQERLAGYRAGLRDAGIPETPEYVQGLDAASMHTGMSRINLNYLGYSPMQRLLQLPKRPTAVFLLFDSIACGALRAIDEAGLKVPDDISLIGVNNDLLSGCLKVPLTTMAQPVIEFGENAAAIIVGKCRDGISGVVHQELSASLLTRESCRVYKELKP